MICLDILHANNGANFQTVTYRITARDEKRQMKSVLIITAGIVPPYLLQNSFNFTSFEVYLFSPPAKNNVNKRRKKGGGLVKHTVLFPSAKLRIH